MIKIDEHTEFGKRVLRRLEDEVIIWLTTVSEDGRPHPRPVWYYWDGELFHIYSRPNTYKLEHIEAHADVSLNFNASDTGSDIVVFLGKAEIRRDLPPATEDTAYVDKYEERMRGMGMAPEDFAERYSVPIWVTPSKVRGH